ncbi:MAG TPA: tRNA (adenosine(37)-N6)-dimethylallyltransferase MiaA [Fimbriimonadaceae bacterium]|nr:tRNA (adenosine(37)-N6)-dimethylallyltransferase MiaA [Fimbriimonadaceae bacterium]
MKPPLLLAIMGPTASGKTALAEDLAGRLEARLINADAFQVYRGLDVGTAKPARREDYELIDIKEPNEAFGVGGWTHLAQAILASAFARNRNVIVVGGTGLYIRALFEEYASMAAEPDPEVRARLNETNIEELRERLRRLDPAIAARTDMANPVRVRRALERLEGKPMDPVRLPPFRKVKLGLLPPTDLLDERIARRTSEMVHNGWIQEIERLSQEGFRRGDPGFRAIGYRTLWDHLERKIGLDEAIATTIAETRRYAKRQRTWLRSEPELVELSTTDDDAVRKAMERIDNVLM